MDSRTSSRSRLACGTSIARNRSRGRSRASRRSRGRRNRRLRRRTTATRARRRCRLSNWSFTTVNIDPSHRKRRITHPPPRPRRWSTAPVPNSLPNKLDRDATTTLQPIAEEQPCCSSPDRNAGRSSSGWRTRCRPNKLSRKHRSHRSSIEPVKKSQCLVPLLSLDNSCLRRNLALRASVGSRRTVIQRLFVSQWNPVQEVRKELLGMVGFCLEMLTAGRADVAQPSRIAVLARLNGSPCRDLWISGSGSDRNNGADGDDLHRGLSRTYKRRVVRRAREMQTRWIYLWRLKLAEFRTRVIFGKYYPYQV